MVVSVHLLLLTAACSVLQQQKADAAVEHKSEHGAARRRGPAAHYVIRASDLSLTLGFTEAVLGLKVIRHEESPSACPIGCNGAYETPWSKTMVGSDSEDTAYALELTYNYGVPGYRTGTGLTRIELIVASAKDSVNAARKLGCFATLSEAELEI